MALLTVLASAYAVISLRNLNDIVYRMTSQDFFIVESGRKMMDALLAQESAERKYLILKDPSLADIFRVRNQEFKERLQELQGRSFPGLSKPLARMQLLNSQYGALFDQEAAMAGEDRLHEAIALSETNGKRLIEDLASQVRVIQHQAERDIDSRMAVIRARSADAFRMTVILTVLSLAAGLCLALLITYNISVPLQKLEKATSMVAEGHFDPDLRISNRDEIGRLARAFGRMTGRLKELEALHLDASPLTGLPGNLAIERRINRADLFSLPGGS